MLELNQIYNGDCLELMNQIDDKSIDLILCDLPFAITDAHWDLPIDLDLLWQQYERIIKDKGAIVLNASQPFTAKLIMSNLKLFRYEWIWEKNIASNFANAKKQPLKNHESVLVFYKKLGVYNPQGLIELDQPKVCDNSNKRKLNHIRGIKSKTYIQTHTNYPKTIQHFDCERGLHGTQKPEKLGQYFLRTYSNENDLILDNCCGSGSYLAAAKNTNRNFIGIEKDQKIFELEKERIEQRNKLK